MFWRKVPAAVGGPALSRSLQMPGKEVVELSVCVVEDTIVSRAAHERPVRRDRHAGDDDLVRPGNEPAGEQVTPESTEMFKRLVPPGETKKEKPS